MPTPPKKRLTIGKDKNGILISTEEETVGSVYFPTRKEALRALKAVRALLKGGKY